MQRQQTQRQLKDSMSLGFLVRNVSKGGSSDKARNHFKDNLSQSEALAEVYGYLSRVVGSEGKIKKSKRLSGKQRSKSRIKEISAPKRQHIKSNTRQERVVVIDILVVRDKTGK